MSKIQLTQKTGSIVFELLKNKDKLESLLNDPNISIQEYKDFISTLVNNISSKTEKSLGTKKFLLGLQKQPNKICVFHFIWSNMLAGDQLSVISSAQKYD